jgi:hypothetical protein
MVRAIAYVNSAVPGPTGFVREHDRQVGCIQQYAAKNKIEIAGWFEDTSQDPDVLSRPGIQAILACEATYDEILCDSPGAIGRSMAVLEPFLQELARMGTRFEAATDSWDCVSQQFRRRIRGLPIRPRVVISGRVRPYRVGKPAHLYFERIVHHGSLPVH